MNAGGPYTGIAPVNPYAIDCPVVGCDNPTELVSPLPGRPDIPATAGVLVCGVHDRMIRRIITTRRGKFHFVLHERYGVSITLVPAPPVSRREWNRVRADLVAVLHELHPAATTKGH